MLPSSGRVGVSKCEARRARRAEAMRAGGRGEVADEPCVQVWVQVWMQAEESSAT